MKLRILSTIFLLAVTAPTFASNNSTETSHGKLYLGVFGGGGSSNDFSASQYGTSFLIEAAGGPLAVNAFGNLKNKAAPFFGAQIGYQSRDIFLKYSSQLAYAPAAELEWYTINKRTFSGNLINNNQRLPEHDFLVSYPMSKNMYLVNAILNFKKQNFIVNPYIGFGIGSAILRISDANSTQIDPTEVGVNHYNSNSSSTSSTFAGQIKLGLSYDMNKYVSFFAEYRWLYLASTDFTFGSTVYADHAETTSWQVKLGSQRYNLGNIGIRVNL